MAGLTCPSCDGTLSEDDKKAGPDAPEVGWEYYECPHCEAQSRPDVVEGADDTAGEEVTSKRTVTATVVQASVPVVLDDGETAFECRGLSASEVSLGQEVTVTGVERSDLSPESDNIDTVLSDCSLDEDE